MNALGSAETLKRNMRLQIEYSKMCKSAYVEKSVDVIREHAISVQDRQPRVKSFVHKKKKKSVVRKFFRKFKCSQTKDDTGNHSANEIFKHTNIRMLINFSLLYRFQIGDWCSWLIVCL